MNIDQRILKAIESIRSHWNEGCTVEEIARHHEVEPDRLCSSFLEIYHITPQDYIESRQREQLVSDLIHHRRLDEELRQGIGFSSEEVFNDWVQRSFGKTITGIRSELGAFVRKHHITT